MPNLFTKKSMTLLASAALGNMIAERFILRVGQGDPSGFVDVADGFGLDDVVRAATIVVTAMFVDKVL